MAHTLFISDLHLPVAASPLRERFARFLAGPARAASALYVLGDLFEVWVGDDAGLREYGAERACLRALTGAGVPVFLQHGNRDFLVGRDFAAATGVQILADPLRLDLGGVPTLISHGDLFCTDDVRYQRFRRFVRNPGVQAAYRALPVSWRERFAGAVRSDSAMHKRLTAADIMDVNDGAIREAFRAQGVARMIHGHTHRPATHDYAVDGRACQRIVLADWRPDLCEALRVDASGVHRVPVN
ncbi:MAG: UDP-2,3-diacylglucosamine diphosphatase [Gammaproteobacteria bacterium]